MPWLYGWEMGLLMFWMWLPTIMLVGLIFLVLVLAPKNSSALRTLQERYAKGEITKEQYEEMKKTLG